MPEQRISLLKYNTNLTDTESNHNKWDLTKLRSFCKAKDTVCKTKGSLLNAKGSLPTPHQTEDLSPK